MKMTTDLLQSPCHEPMPCLGSLLACWTEGDVLCTQLIGLFISLHTVDRFVYQCMVPLITISKLFFTALCPLVRHSVCVCVCVCVCVSGCISVCMCVHACVCVVSVIVKHPVLPPSVIDGHSRNPLYYYFLVLCTGQLIIKIICVDNT